MSHDVWGADFGRIAGMCPHNCSHRGSHGGACITCGCPTSTLPGPAPEPDLTAELDAAEEIVTGRRELLGYVVITYGLQPGRPFAGFLLATRGEAGRMAATAKTGPGERHVVAEVFAVEDEEHGGHPV